MSENEIKEEWPGQAEFLRKSENEIKRMEARAAEQIRFVRNSKEQDDLMREFNRLHGDRILELTDSHSTHSKENNAEVTRLLTELKGIRQKSAFYKPLFANYHPSWMNVPRVREKPKWYLNWMEQKRQMAELSGNPNQQTAGRKSRKKRNRKNKSRRR